MYRCLRLLFLTAAFLAIASAQTITTVAGANWVFPASPLPALQAPLGQVGAVAVDTAGNYYIGDVQNYIVLKVDSSGILSIVAGNRTYAYSGDGGPATSASITAPYGLVVDASGNLFIADTFNNRVRKVDTNGVITTVAGNGTPGYSGDNGPATSASLNQPYGLALDTSGNLFISDGNNQRVREVTSAGVIVTVAGNGVAGYWGDNGPATSAALHNPRGLVVATSGNLFVVDELNNVVREVTTAGVISTVVGNGTAGYAGDNGPSTSAQLYLPRAVQLDALGSLYIADQANNRIRKVTGGIITTIAGDGTQGFSGDGGLADSASLNNPRDLAVDTSGNVFIADLLNSRVRKLTTDGAITTVAGNGGYLRFSGDGGPATSAALQRPENVAVDSLGDFFIADTFNTRIRMVTAAGIINTIAGNGVPGYTGDTGPATSAGLTAPAGAAMDSSGNLYIADTGNNVVRMVTPGGIITTVAGNGTAGYTGDTGPATSASLNYPSGVAVDTSGNLYIADQFNHVVREVIAGTITTVAGNGTAGYTGDDGLATDAEIGSPAAVAVDASGDLYITDTTNSVVRKVAAGVITTAAGIGGYGYSGDNGPAISAKLNYPIGVAVDASSNLFIADSGNSVIRKVDSGGTITTIAGNGRYGYAGDNGPATDASLAAPQGVAIDAACNLFIADTNNNRIRKIAGLSVTPTTVFLDATAQAGPALSVLADPTCAWTSASDVPWMSIVSGASGTGNGNVTFSVEANSTGAPRASTLIVGTPAVSVTQRETAQVFSDVAPPDYYFDFANIMYQSGITSGCSTTPLNYCPSGTTTRGQMAVFLIVAIEGGSSFTYTPTPYFTDVPASSPYFKFVQKLRDLGITSGCSPTQFCPDNPVTRAEMAVFVIQSRYRGIPFTYPTTPYFTDVPATSAFFPFVQKMAQAGITAGCGSNRFCPNDSLTRGQMAVFIVTGLLNELLSAGTPYIGTVAPNTAAAGQTLTVTVTGVDTHFAQGTTQVAVAPGITASNITVTSATSLTVDLTVGASMATGPTTIVATTGTEEAVLPNGFTVQ